MIDAQLIETLNNTMEMSIPVTLDEEELHQQLSVYIGQLIETDFQKLVNLLYRIDVSETKLRSFLTDNPDSDAASIIAGLIIERQLQKIKSREQFKQRGEGGDW
jgi:hypothetical protein